MTSLKRWIRDLLSFSSKETNAFIILLPLIAIIIFAQPLYHGLFNSERADLIKDRQRLDSLIAHWEQEQKLDIPPDRKIELTTNKLFLFDPNKATNNELNNLGFSNGLAKRIIHYRNKGGRFRIKSDLLKIYGVDSALYNQLYAYIILPESLQDPIQKKESDNKPNVERAKFDLNLADTTLLKKINGIGPILANRIMKYRESLGGFIRSGQVHEVYGLDSTVVDLLLKASFVESNFRPRQLNINVASEAELDVHPYINKATANALVAYRFQHGLFKSVEEIRKIVIIKNDIADKIIPYLKTQ